MVGLFVLMAVLVIHEKARPQKTCQLVPAAVTFTRAQRSDHMEQVSRLASRQLRGIEELHEKAYGSARLEH